MSKNQRVSGKGIVRGNGLLRYSVALIGPIGSAGTQFVLSFVLLRATDASAFGRFSFLLIASQLSWGVWTALVCAPLPILLATGDAAARARARQCLIAVNLVGGIMAFAVFLAVAAALGETALGGALFAAYAALALFRWFARAQAYATGAPLRTTASDIVYSAVMLGGTVLLVLGRTATIDAAWGVMFIATLTGLAPFGRRYLFQQFLRVPFAAIAGYPAIWRQHAGWSLFGVATTEATANAHAYLVTVLRGPAAFAPLAASALMIRPISVAMNALTEFERAQMARQIGAGRIDLAVSAVRFFRIVLIAAWLVTGVAIVALLHFAPRLIFPARYDLVTLEIGAGLWMAVAGMRLWRTPDSALLQAAGAFRPLAFASVWSALVSTAAVVILLLAVGPLWSIGGILLGEAIFAWVTSRQARRWLAAQGDSAGRAGAMQGGG